MEVSEKAVFFFIRSGHSEQLHLSSFMRWEENFTQSCSTRPSEKYADCGCTWAAETGL
jgi:hypothetical protein